MGLLNLFGNSDKKEIEKAEEILEEDNIGNTVQSDLDIVAKDMLTEILDLMGFFNVVKVVKTEPTFIHLEIKGDDMGRIIGREGGTLYALQLLLRNMLSKKYKQPIKVVLDCNGYRDKRADGIKRMALEQAEIAIAEKKEVVLRPMNSWERRVVHMALQDNAKVKTESTGDNADRQVVVIPV